MAPRVLLPRTPGGDTILYEDVAAVNVARPGLRSEASDGGQRPPAPAWGMGAADTCLTDEA